MTHAKESTQNDAKRFEIIMDRLFSATGAISDAEFARQMGIKRQSVYNARRKKKLPKTWIRRLRDDVKINPEWVQTGEGDAYLPGYEGVKMVMTAPKSPTPEREREIFERGLPQSEDEKLYGPTIPRDGSTTVLMLGAVNSRLNLPPDKIPSGVVYGSDYVKARYVEDFVNIPYIQPWLSQDGYVVPSDDLPPIAMRRSAIDRFSEDWRKIVWMQSAVADMAPKILPGDELLVDLGQTQSITGAIYVIEVANNILVRTQTIGPNGAAFKAVDRMAEPIPADSCTVLGRVLRICHVII